MIIARQLAYHRENKEKYLAYMRTYNKAYYLKNKPPPKPKKEKVVKEKKPKKPKKEVAVRVKKVAVKPSYDYVEPVYEYPTKYERGVFVLHFD